MLLNAYNPYWWTVPQARGDRRSWGSPMGFYKVCTNSVTVGDDEVVYGVDTHLFGCLPYECIVLLSVSADCPESGDSYPVYISAAGKNMPVLDSDGNAVTGTDMEAGDIKLAYLNKSTGTIRFLN